MLRHVSEEKNKHHILRMEDGSGKCMLTKLGHDDDFHATVQIAFQRLQT